MKKASFFLQQTQFFLLHLVFLLTPFVFTWVNNELFEFNKMLVIYSFAFTFIGLWLGRMVLEKRLIWRSHPLNWLVFIFLVGQTLSFISSMHLPSSWWGYSSRLNGGLLSSLAFAGIYFSVFSSISKKQAQQLLLTNAISLGLVSLYAIPEHFGVSPSCAIISGEWNVSCWKQDVQSRVFASFGQPNWLAAYLVTLSPVSWWITLKTKSKNHKFVFGTISLLALLALWYTGSKSGLLAYGATGLTFGLGWIALRWDFNWLKAKISKVNKSTKISVALTIILLGVFLGHKHLVLPIQQAGNYTLGADISQENFDLSKGSSSADIRKIVWYGAWKVWQRYPLFGSGPATFAYSYYQDRPVAHNLVSEWDFLYNKAHNEILNYLAETGIIGLGGYLVFIAGSLWLLIKQKKLLNVAIVSGLIGMHVSNFFGFSTAMTNLLLFVLPSLGIVLTSQTLPVRKNIKFSQYSQKALLIGIFIAWCFLGSFLVKTWLGDYYNTLGKSLIKISQPAEGLEHQQKAVELSPRKSEYYESLANAYTGPALYYQDRDAGTAQDLFEAALANIDYALALNPHHLNFYKTKVRVLIFLEEFSPTGMEEAEQTLKTAIEISPTDAKLWHNLGIVLEGQEKNQEAIEVLKKTIELKPDYVKSREKLGDFYLEVGEVEKAVEQYRFILEKLSSANSEVRQKLEEAENQTQNQIQ